MRPTDFVRALSTISLPGTFNPYRDVCKLYDHVKSPEIRKENLEAYLTAAVVQGIDSVWIARDCGYRGARRTGIALTDEPHLHMFERHFGLQGIRKATTREWLKERTATEVWKVIKETDAKIFLWNVFPFHPFDGEDPMSNRCHTVSEFNECKHLLMDLLRLLSPKTIVAIGGDAQRGLGKLGFAAVPVRHPSYGGHIEFRTAIRTLYR
jgi:hypothetical protein